MQMGMTRPCVRRDGWNGAQLTIDGSSFTLSNGASSSDCLNHDAGMVDITCSGSSWLEEISWKLKHGDTVLKEGGCPFTGSVDLPAG